MKRNLFFAGIGLALVLLALGGWAVKGLRRGLRPRRALRPAYA
jgi:hypothetical protein